MTQYKTYDQMTEEEIKDSQRRQQARFEELETFSRERIIELIVERYGSDAGIHEWTPTICLIGSIADKEFPERIGEFLQNPQDMAEWMAWKEPKFMVITVNS